ncbi:MAG TPA: chorismate synthase, partial [Ardenticatenaceae bacterium]|nr:chorismate synthase [Ardenticatenaceae bacterium]
MLRFLTAGESHGPALTAILEGIPSGVPLTSEQIDDDLLRRQTGFGSGGRMKIERDTVSITSGVVNGRTIGAPIALHVRNDDWPNWDGRLVKPVTRPRPGHADLTGGQKYAYDDLRLALERASARETAMRVAVGAVCKALLRELGITIGSYVVELGPLKADLGPPDFPARFARAESNDLRCPDEHSIEALRTLVSETKKNKDTLGGIFEVVALGVPAGLGSHVHWDRKLEGRLAQAMMSIQAVKGVELGPAFENARVPGSQVHDEMEWRDQEVARRSNRAGGTEGGITTGEPVVVRAAMKPISTLLMGRDSVNLTTGENERTIYERSDITAVPRACVVGEAMV